MAVLGIKINLDNKQDGGALQLNNTALGRGVLSYIPSVPSRNAETVTETIRVWFASGLQAATQGSGVLRRVGHYFVDARRRAELGQGDRIFIVFNKGIGDGDWRSEILDGQIVYPPETLGAGYLLSDAGEVAIIITRRAYWEKDAELEIPLNNTSQATYVNGGVDIENHHDLGVGDNNWVMWREPSVIGDLPTPLRVEFTNTHATHDYRRVLMALTHDTENNSGAMSTNWSLEGEANAYNPGTVTANTNSSGGNYIVEAYTATTETLVGTWTLTPTEFARGNPFRAVARMWSAYDNLYARLVIVAAAATGDGEVWRSKLVKVTYAAGAAEELCDLGTIPGIPPHMPDGLEAQEVRIFLYFLRNASGAHTINIDHITFMPMDGGFRRVETSSYQNAMQQNDTLIDDGILGRTYMEVGAGTFVTMFTTQGDYLYALPHKPGRLTFLWQTSANLARADLTATVRVFYRPRRVTL